ncbi:MAG: hypothetical protein SCALA702_00070 [Melioribacteraceae bacterium]|nr:MAG: hypothetical protein SCALA702_00070 [Melioribacteraceae bacterium]
MKNFVILIMCVISILSCSENSTKSLPEPEITYNVPNVVREVIRFKRIDGNAPIRFYGQAVAFYLEELRSNYYFLEKGGNYIDTVVYENEYLYITEYFATADDVIHADGRLTMEYLWSQPDTGRFMVSLTKFEYAYNQENGQRRPTTELEVIHTQSDTFAYPYFVSFYSSYTYHLNSVMNY